MNDFDYLKWREKAFKDPDFTKFISDVAGARCSIVRMKDIELLLWLAPKVWIVFRYITHCYMSNGG